MSRKKKNQLVENSSQSYSRNVLPQNILLIGEQIVENKNIYISQVAYQAIHKFTHDKITNESGGMLIGYVVDEFEKTNIVITAFVEAKYCEATPTTLKFTHKTWEYCHEEIAKKHKEEKIVGWIHTHPGFGIFLSEYDKFIQNNFFKEDYQVAFVVDPVQQVEGFYIWNNGVIERCKGFYIFAKTGVRITNNDQPGVNIESKKVKGVLSFNEVLIIVVILITTFLSVNVILLKERVSILENDLHSVMLNSELKYQYFSRQENELKSNTGQSNVQDVAKDQASKNKNPE